MGNATRQWSAETFWLGIIVYDTDSVNVEKLCGNGLFEKIY